MGFHPIVSSMAPLSVRADARDSAARGARGPGAAIGDERAVVARIRAGDAVAFQMVFDWYAPLLYRFLVGRVSAPAIAEELVQDVFVWMWEHRDTLTLRETLRAYLYAAAHHRALNVRRRERLEAMWTARATRDISGEWVGRVAAPGLERIAADETAAQLRVAIAELPEQRRTIVTLRWHHHLTPREIAATLGVSIKTVENQITRALRTLRHRLTHDIA